MTATTAETLTVDGVLLNTLAKNIESIAGRLSVPVIRTDNVAVPSRHGRLRTTQKFYDEGQLVLPMWVKGCDDNGNVPTSARQMFYSNVNALSNLFRPGSGMMTMVHTLPDHSIRRAMVECTEAINFSVLGGNNPLGKFSVALRVPKAFWEDVNPFSIDLTSVQNGAVTTFDGTTAPVEDSVITITGPATGCKIEARYGGNALENPSWVQYNGTLTAGQTLIIDCGNWTLTGTGGLVVNYSFLAHAGGARWFTMVPGPPSLPPEVKITATGTTGATKINISARRKFLVG
jgi:hypothetical protein